MTGEIETLDRIRQVVLREGSSGSTVTLGDIAVVDRGPRTPASEYAIANGKAAILIGVLAQDGVQIDRWMGFVRDELAAGADFVPLGIEEELLFDQSTYTLDRLADVGTNMAIGIGLVVAGIACYAWAQGRGDRSACLTSRISCDACHHEFHRPADPSDVGDRSDRGPRSAGRCRNRRDRRGAPKTGRRNGAD